jgi:hypothetical protein
MSTQDKTQSTTNDGGVAELAARLAALEVVRESEIAAKNYLPTPKVSAFAMTMTEQAERVRQERRRAYEAEVEAARVQAVKDAPKRAKREREIAGFDKHISKLRDEQNAISRMIREVTVARQAVVWKPL